MLGNIISGVSAGIGLYQGNQAKKDAKRAGKKQAAIEREVTAEELRQLGRERQQSLGMLRGQLAASGVDITGQGTAQALEQDMAREFQLTRRFTQDVGASQAKAVERRGQAVGNQIWMNSIGNALNVTASIFDDLDL